MTTATVAPVATAAPGGGAPIATESSLSNWVGPYVTDMLAKGQALSETPYEAYTGPLTAGTSDLQNQAFSGLAGLTVPSSITNAGTAAGNIGSMMGGMKYDPTQFTSTFTAPKDYQTGQFGFNKFTADDAQAYMNPYLMNALQPQIDEARRQAEIQRLGDATRLGKAGAYGGSRQGIMEAEGDRNLLSNLANITGTGYKQAYDTAAQQFGVDENRRLSTEQATEASRQFGSTQGMTSAQLAAQYAQGAQQDTEKSKQFGANYGLDALKSQLDATKAQADIGRTGLDAQLANIKAQTEGGAQQRAIEQEGVAADIKAFEEQRDDPFKKVQYQQSLLNGLPLGTQTYSYSDPSSLTKLLSSTGGIRELYDQIFGTSAPSPTGSPTVTSTPRVTPAVTPAVTTISV